MSDQVVISGVSFSTLVAISPSEQEVGLMWKRWPPPVMCFPYRDAAVRKFWMKNTVSPLDVLFCKGQKIVAIYRGEPLSTLCFGPNEPVDLVIELPAGTVTAENIGVGDCATLRFSAGTAARFVKS